MGAHSRAGSIQTEMNRLFTNFFEPTAGSNGGNGVFRRWTPAMDLVETEDNYVLRADLPACPRAT